MCSSILITVVDEEAGNTITLAHFSVREFLILEDSSQKIAQWYQVTTNVAHRLIAARLFECLFDDAKSPHSLVLHDYAHSYWPAHLEECDMSDKFTSVQSRFDIPFHKEAHRRLLQSLVLHCTDLLLMFMVHSRGDTHNFVDWLLHHIKTVDEDLIEVVALTPYAYEIKGFVLSTVSSDPQTIERTASEVYRQLLIWRSSDSRVPLLREFFGLVAFDCHPSVTEVGIWLRLGDAFARNFTSYLGAGTYGFNSSDPDTRNKIMSLLIDQSIISDPLQESTVSLIAVFFDLEVFSALLHKYWNKVPITRLVLRAIARNRRLSWSSFQRLIFSLHAAGLKLSNDIVTFIASSSAYNLLRWPIYKHMVAQDIAEGGGIHEICLSGSHEVVRFTSPL